MDAQHIKEWFTVNFKCLGIKILNGYDKLIKIDILGSDNYIEISTVVETNIGTMLYIADEQQMLFVQDEEILANMPWPAPVDYKKNFQKLILCLLKNKNES